MPSDAAAGSNDIRDQISPKNFSNGPMIVVGRFFPLLHSEPS
jgi:hypothetical protein